MLILLAATAGATNETQPLEDKEGAIPATGAAVAERATAASNLENCPFPSLHLLLRVQQTRLLTSFFRLRSPRMEKLSTPAELYSALLPAIKRSLGPSRVQVLHLQMPAKVQRLSSVLISSLSKMQSPLDPPSIERRLTFLQHLEDGLASSPAYLSFPLCLL